MRIAFLCKRRYMGKDVVNDCYGRLYEYPAQLARRGHDVLGLCLDYHHPGGGEQEHEQPAGVLRWEAFSLRNGTLRAAGYPARVLSRLRAWEPDVVIGASDIPHVALAAWLSQRLRVPYAIDLYDNFEGFGQARIPGMVALLRHATRGAALVTTTSEPLRRLVLETYRARGRVISMPSGVDLSVFHPGDKRAARGRLGLPLGARLLGTAGGLHRDKGVEPLYRAWETLAARDPESVLVLAGPHEPDCPPPSGDRVLYLGQLSHAKVADLFRALDVGVISILDTAFGRYCFPQKAYEMLACELPIVAARVGQLEELLAATPQLLFPSGDAEALAEAILQQLNRPIRPDLPILDWEALLAGIEPALRMLADTKSR